LKIVLFTENYHRGGVDTFIATLLNHWPDPGTEFTLICNHDHPGLKDIENRLKRPCRFITHNIATYSGLAIKTRGKLIPDLFRKLFTPVIKYLYIVLGIFRLRSILCNEQYDRLLIINGGYPGGDTCRAAGITWGLFSNRPLSVHNFHGLSVPPRKLLWLQEYFTDMLLSRLTQSFVTVSAAAVSSLALRSAIPASKVHYIHNGIEQPNLLKQQCDIRTEIGIQNTTPICLMLGAYESYKGHEFLLSAFRLIVDTIPSAHLVICGHGTPQDIKAVQNKVNQLTLQNNVALLNFRTDAMTILSQSDILLVTSQQFESFGLTCVEAMALRIPVVTTRVGGLPEVVADNEGGYCIGKDDIKQYSEIVIKLLNSSELRQIQGELGYRRYLKLFTANRMADNYAMLFKPNKNIIAG